MSASFCKCLPTQSPFPIKYFKRLLIIGLALWLLLLSAPVFSAVDVTGKTRWTIPELNMSITLPRTLCVITRDEISHSQRLVNLGYNIAQLQSWLSSNSAYLNAYAEDSSYEIMITMVENQSTHYMWDHSNYSDTKLWYEAENRLNSNSNGQVVEVRNIYRTTTATYIVADLEQTRGQNKVYSQQYFTTYNGQGINITLHSYQGPLDVNLLNFHKQIIDSISFTAIKQSIIDTYGIDRSRVSQKALNGALIVFLFFGLSAAIKAIKKYVFKIPSDKKTPPLGLVFLVLVIIVMTLTLLSLWGEKQISQLNLSSLPQPDVEALPPSYDNEIDITAYPVPSQATTPHSALVPEVVAPQNIEFKPVVANIMGKHYLMMTMSVEAETPVLAAEIYQKMPQFRDVILILLSRLSYDDISSLDGKMRLRNQILNRLNTQLSSGEVKNIYFSEFVVQ